MSIFTKSKFCRKGIVGLLPLLLVFTLLAAGFFVAGNIKRKTNFNPKASLDEQVYKTWDFKGTTTEGWQKTNFATGNVKDDYMYTVVISASKNSILQNDAVFTELPPGAKKVKLNFKVGDPASKRPPVTPPQYGRFSAEIRYMLKDTTSWRGPLTIKGMIDSQPTDYEVSLPEQEKINISKLQILFLPLPSKTQFWVDWIRLISDTTLTRRVFVTSTLYNGNLGGYPGADRKCQESANSANLGGNWKAWLSDGIEPSVSTRLLHNNGPYVLLDNTMIATNWNDLTDGTLLNPVNLTELKTTIPEVVNGWNVWTNTKNNGDVDERLDVVTCRSFHSDEYSPTLMGSGGSSARKDYFWTDPSYSGHTCDTKARLYCFEQ